MNDINSEEETLPISEYTGEPYDPAWGYQLHEKRRNSLLTRPSNPNLDITIMRHTELAIFDWLKVWLENVVAGLRFLNSCRVLMCLSLGIALGSLLYIPLSGKQHFSSLVFLTITLAWIILFYMGFSQVSKNYKGYFNVQGDQETLGSIHVTPPPGPVFEDGGRRLALNERTDERYDEPVACYPTMERI